MSAAPVVTGWGSVSACGHDPISFEATLATGEPVLREVDRDAGFHRPDGARTAAIPNPIAAAPWIKPMAARRMSPPSRYATIAARQALAGAALQLGGRRDAELGVVVATTFGPASFTQRLLDQAFADGPGAISPMLFTECVANAAPAQIGIQIGAAGPNHAVSAREAGPLVALGRAVALLREGQARRALAGNVEEITPLLHALLDRFDALARDRARPFGAARDGFHAAEGATVLLLETAEAAAERGAEPRARVVAVGGGFDPTASPVGWGDGAAALADGLRRTLDRAGIARESVDLVVSGASGSRGGDRLEARMLHAVWGDRSLPPVVAPKAITGEYGGPFLGAALAALKGKLPGAPAAVGEAGNAGGAPWEIDPDLGIVPAHGRTLPEPPRRILVSSLASGGAAAWAVLDAP